MVRVAALRVGGRRAALAVLLGGQVLAARRGRRRHRLRVVVEVAGVALGGGRGQAAARAVVAVAHVRAAGRGGRREVPVAVGPVAAAGDGQGKGSLLCRGGNRKQGNLCSDAQHLLSKPPCSAGHSMATGERDANFFVNFFHS